MATAKTTKIRLLPHHSVVIDGQVVGEGAIVAVETEEAGLLVGDGYAMFDLGGTGSGKRTSKRGSKRRRPLDLAAAEDEPDVLERGGDSASGEAMVI